MTPQSGSGRKSAVAHAVHRGERRDIDLPGQYPVTPQIKGAIKAMQGVLAVEEL